MVSDAAYQEQDEKIAEFVIEEDAASASADGATTSDVNLKCGGCDSYYNYTPSGYYKPTYCGHDTCYRV